ncbi:MAG: hypothetical protein FJ296_10665, partial [Planctomycetes bacterium]|nr:hypothetical protein [Planctomycetota bacterium]
MPLALADALVAADTVRLLAALAVLLFSARLLGETARRFGQAPVLGEIIAGIVLGPTLLGRAAPGAFEWLFPAAGPPALVRDSVAGLALVWFMFAAGLEVDLSSVLRRGRAALWVSLAGVVVPFAVGFAAAAAAPDLFGREAGAPPGTFAFMLGTAVAISALPVIARTLLDLDLFRTDFGALVITAAVVNDLLGWLIFASLLALVQAGGGAPTVGAAGLELPLVLVSVLAFGGLVLTLGRWLLDRALPHVQAWASFPAGGLGLGLSLALAGAALTEALGVHAIFGAFLVGVALGDSRHLRERTRSTIEQFVGGGLAPIFFASIGLKTDFAASFDPLLCALVLAIACLGKVGGGLLGARLAGLPRREALATGIALNARGAMEIILGLVALRAGLIGQRLYVALVVMALVTSLLCPPLLRALLKPPRKRRLADVLGGRCVLLGLQADDAAQAIARLSELVAAEGRLDAAQVRRAVQQREALRSTGLG